MIDTAILNQASQSADLIEGGLSFISFFQFAVGLVLVGVTIGLLERWMLGGRRVGARFWLIAIAAIVVGSFLILLAIPGSAARFLTERMSLLSPEWTAGGVRMSALLLIIASGMLLSAGWWDRMHVMGPGRALRAILPVLPPAAIGFFLGWLLLVLWPHDLGSGPIPLQKPVWLRGPLSLVLLLFGINAGGIARAVAHRGLNRLASLVIAAPPTVALLILNFWLFSLAINNCGTNWLAAQVLLGSDATESVSLTRIFGRWAIGYFVFVSLLGLGGGVGIRLGPKPRIRRTGRSIEIPQVMIPTGEPVASSENLT